MPDLTLFHTAEVHVTTFAALAPSADLQQVVRSDWLERAQQGIPPELEQEITAAIQATSGPVLCTCTTLGEVAEKAGATRLDWPMMQEAARIGGPVLMAYCLDSTAAPSTVLLRRAFTDLDKEPELRSLPLTGLWGHFTEGDNKRFEAEIATWISTSLKMLPDTSCVVLAQASMAGAAEILQRQTAIPILASPAIAMKHLLGE
ncbi:hypothetical protein RSK20926_03194 [Roseobacter sp. SK209-2-6]|uniref:hypothetical protein n=1 Tax=Roseobacter sp. SK209-2-6 TaxID=388739 RepID=UPI0000F3ECCE|nr:hypothetical protein [Roseobacter sp. SK209-2-6]EBA16777.1 hypothetical protein RSK20926_03194 [Roseobacter sp. SK209-2-6]